MKKSHLYAGTFLVIQLFLPTHLSTGYSQTRLTSLKPEVQDYMTSIGSQNRSTPLEGAGAHGLEGWRVGAGMASTSVKPESQKLMSQAIYGDDSKSTSSLMIPKMWVTKGLFYPLDVGFHFSSIPNTEVSQAGAYLQWTLFEALAMPALAIRGAYGKSYGFKNTELATTSVGAFTSWGLAFVSIYLGYGLHQHRASLLDEGSSGEASHLYLSGWTETTTTSGIQFQILPPFVQLSAEANFSNLKTRSLQAKLSVGI